MGAGVVDTPSVDFLEHLCQRHFTLVFLHHAGDWIGETLQGFLHHYDSVVNQSLEVKGIKRKKKPHTQRTLEMMDRSN